jgi:hypothetical protein
MESQQFQEWVEAGAPEPIAAEEVNEGDCAYEDCDSKAEYRVQWDKGDVTSLMCGDCSTKNRIYVVENELLRGEVTA